MEDDELFKQIGNNIKYYRNLKGVSQDNLSYASEVCRGYFGRCERGERRPSVRTLYKIAKALSVPLYKLVILKGETYEK